MRCLDSPTENSGNVPAVDYTVDGTKSGATIYRFTRKAIVCRKVESIPNVGRALVDGIKGHDTRCAENDFASCKYAVL